MRNLLSLDISRMCFRAVAQDGMRAFDPARMNRKAIVSVCGSVLGGSFLTSVG
jgi:hypothetical protein